MIYSLKAKIISNKQIATNIYESYLYAPEIAKISKPGQFINIIPSENWSNVMRRPMSIASQSKNSISIIYKVFGEGTDLISKWNKTDIVEILGPLGNCWSIDNNKKSILIGGGVGIAPILNLYNNLKDRHFPRSLIMGSRTGSEHFMNHDIKNNIVLTTDDGTIGIKGNVMNGFQKVVKKEDYSKIKIFSCGPPFMMEAIREYANEHNIECELALETIMACGIGICQGCAIKMNENTYKHSYRTQYKLACVDGPVFNSKKIVSCHD